MRLGAATTALIVVSVVLLTTAFGTLVQMKKAESLNIIEEL